MNAFWWRITKNCVNANLIRIQQGSQKPDIIYLPNTWLTRFLGTVLLHLAAPQEHLVSFHKSPRSPALPSTSELGIYGDGSGDRFSPF